MAITAILCARCATSNALPSRFCARCGLPLGTPTADADAGLDALGPYERPEPTDPDAGALARELAARSGFDAEPAGPGWRIAVPLPMDRHQVVYAGAVGTDPEGRALLALVSVCGPASDRDARILLKLNARAIDGHFAIKVLRGEEYFVVTRLIPADSVADLDPAGLVRRIAEAADGLELRLSRGQDLY